MPYAAFDPSCHVLQNPKRADLERAATEIDQAGLMIFGYPFDSFDALIAFNRLEVLKIQGAPKLTKLDGLEHLQGLRALVLGSTTDGRRIEVESFRPLERLPRLERLILGGVRPRDLDTSPLTRMQQLRELEVGGVPEFTLEHFAKLSVALPNTVGRTLQPYVEIRGVGKCRKCERHQVLLNGAPPRARKWVCPGCNPKLLAAHVDKWVAITGRSMPRAL